MQKQPPLLGVTRPNGVTFGHLAHTEANTLFGTTGMRYDH
jgi:hypothetical protein